MSYYLKKTCIKGRTYLSIDESFYSSEKKGTAHRCYKSLGSVETALKKGMEDPIAFYQSEVDRLNKEVSEKKEKEKLISASPMRYAGYFPLQAIMAHMKIKTFIDYFKFTTDFKFDLYDVLTDLIYARAVHPCSKLRTFHEVMPQLLNHSNITYDQLLQALGFYGNNYEKIVELFTQQTKKYYGLDTTNTYFDCTNFYFEIDREDDLRRKGPSKENRRDPIVGLGLLLDSNQIPIGMKIYPGNESEKPILRETISSLKEQNQITGKTVQIADKGLNCAENIYEAIRNGNGYLFSKSVKALPSIEKEWIWLEDGWCDVKDSTGKVLYRYKSCIDAFKYQFTDDNNEKKVFEIDEKRVVTYNPSLAKKQIYEIDKMVEKAKGFTFSRAKKSECGEAAKYITYLPIDKNGEIDDNAVIATAIDEEKILQDKKLAGYNLLVTSERNMPDEKVYSVYHNLWRIEESFRIMKSDLDARPVYCQKEDTIKGHFLICYLTVLLIRIFQFKVLENKYSSSEVMNFIKEFILVKGERGYINVTSKTAFIIDFAKLTDLPLLNYNLSETKVNKILSCII